MRRGVVQRWCASLYERHGSKILYVAMALPALSGSVFTLVMAIWLAEFLDLSGGEFLTVVLIGVPPLALGIVAIIFVGRDWFRRLLRWDADRANPAETAEVWDLTQQLTFTFIVKRGIKLNVFLLPPILTAVIVAVLHLPWYVGLPVWCTFAISRLVNALFAVFAIEILLRPFMEDIAGHLPADFAASQPGWQLRSKALAPLPMITLFGAMSAGAFADLVASGPARLGLTLGIGVATVLLLGPGLWVTSRSSLDPIDSLLAGTQRIRAGDYTTKVPVVTADELGELASSFNLMMNAVRAAQARVVAAADAERRRVERDLHDGAQQQLVLLKLQLGLVRRKVAGDTEMDAMVADLQKGLDTALQELRDLAHGIYPTVLENEGLAAALRDAAKRSPIPATVDVDGDRRFPPETEIAVYFCCLEALQNAAKYAGDSARATVTIEAQDDELRFAVADDGRGFTMNGSSSTGLQNMADRIGALGGTLHVESRPGGGTRISGTVRTAG
jgi:signal transduction histidine kinase